MNSRYTALLTGLLYLFLAAPVQSFGASREMENLDRGVVAIPTSGNGSQMYVGWRMLGTEPNSVGFNVYRNGSKINGSPITSSCNYVDTAGSLSATYSVAAVIDGEEQERSNPVAAWNAAYLGSGAYMGCQEIPLEPRTGYYPNEAGVGDLDGDGDYELVLKRLSQDQTHTSITYNLIEAYHMDGTLMWTINLGPNNLFSPYEINPIVYDFDGDGRAEVAIRTCEGNIDGVGVQIGDTDGDGVTDYRSTAVLNSSYYMIDGPEFISIFDGETGAEITRADYIERDPISQWGSPGMNDAQYGHRADKCMMTPAYLDGQTPSLVICRGIYHKTVLEAWSFRNGTLSKQWTFNSDNWPGYAGQGNHNLTVGDVDGDGKDEIVYASMCVDDDGTGLYTTELGHGDALHMSKMIPDRDGLQVFAVHESAPYGATLRDAGTGEILWRHTAGGDTGRGCAAHIDSRYPGYQMWSVDSGGTYNAVDETLISSSVPNWGNFLIWWTGDLQREILDGAGSSSPSPIINKWDESTDSAYRLVSLYNYPSQYAAKCINGTKSNPCISGDLIGDWREEAIYPSADGTKLYIYATTAVTPHRIYTLMHDSQYRTAMAWQCNMYNQPPHPSFYIGAGMSTPPTPDIVLVSADATPPQVPAGLVTSTADDSVQLDWADNMEADLAGYTVYRSSIAGSSYTAIASNIVSSSFSDFNVESSTVYYYVVTATDNALNESGFSIDANITTGIILRPAAIPVAYFRFEEGTAESPVPYGGNLVVDSDGGDDNLNAYNEAAAPDYSAKVPAATLSQTGATNTISTYYDGNDDLYTSVVGPLMTTMYTNFTIEAYVNFDSLSGFQTLVGRDDNWDASGGVDGHVQALFYLSKAGDNHFRVEASTVGGDLLAVESSVFASTGIWYHVAAVGDTAASTLTLYIDGQLVGTSAGFDGLYPTATHAWTMGRGQYNGGIADHLNGYLDEVRVTASALEPSQFLNAFNPDMDNDGLEDAWELAHFENLHQTGTDDPDGDGVDNETEETNNDFPTISSIPPNIGISFNGDNMGLGWSSNHQGWVLESRTNLLGGAGWLPISGSDMTNGYEAVVGQPGMFYRLVYP